MNRSTTSLLDRLFVLIAVISLWLLSLTMLVSVRNGRDQRALSRDSQCRLLDGLEGHRNMREFGSLNSWEGASVVDGLEGHRTKRLIDGLEGHRAQRQFGSLNGGEVVSGMDRQASRPRQYRPSEELANRPETILTVAFREDDPRSYPPLEAPASAPRQPRPVNGSTALLRGNRHPELDPYFQLERLPRVNAPVASSMGMQDGLEVATIDLFQQAIGNHKLLLNHPTVTWTLDDALAAALAYSHRIEQFKITPLERFHDVGLKMGQFDVNLFLQQRYGESSDPVASQFDSDGSVDRIDGQRFSLEGGFRKNLNHGGTIELSQSLETRDDNSGVLQPPNQARGDLTLGFTKDLLRGSGRSVAMNEVLVAFHNGYAQKSESTAEIASHLTEVSEAYWQLYSARGALIANEEVIQLSQQLLQQLLQRVEIDAEEELLEQVRIAIKQGEIQRRQAILDLRSAQFELMKLTNAPEFLGASELPEIITVVSDKVPEGMIDRDARIQTAFQRRPEVDQLIQETRVGQLENHFSLNQLLPVLRFAIDASFQGLAGNRDVAGALRNRFDADGGYEVGFDIEFPLQNREARFRRRQTELALARLSQQWQATLAEVRADVLAAAETLDAKREQQLQQQEVFNQTLRRLRALEVRLFVVPPENASTSFQLNQLVTVLGQLAEAKSAYARAVSEIGSGLVDLNRSTGILVQSQDLGLGQLGRRKAWVVYRQFAEEKKSLLPATDRVQAQVNRAIRAPVATVGFEYPEHDVGHGLGQAWPVPQTETGVIEQQAGSYSEESSGANLLQPQKTWPSRLQGTSNDATSPRFRVEGSMAPPSRSLPGSRSDDLPEFESLPPPLEDRGGRGSERLPLNPRTSWRRGFGRLF